MTATGAERQARYRARRVAEETTQDTLLAAILALTEEVRASRDAVLAALQGGGQTVDRSVARGGQALRDGSATSADARPSRDGARPRARTRGGDVAPAPYGGLGATRHDDVQEDSWRVLQAMAGRSAHVGSIHDALGDGWPLARVTAALVYAQDHGQVRREAGATPHVPDRWVPCPDPILDEVVQVLPIMAVEPAPTLHVAGCLDYQAHTTSHRWDASLDAFVCGQCHPATQPSGPAPVSVAT